MKSTEHGRFYCFLVLVIVNNEQQQDSFLHFCCPISFLVTWLTSFLQREKMAVLTRGTKFLNLLLLLLLLIYYERLSNNY